jgi:hypothetical protein
MGAVSPGPSTTGKRLVCRPLPRRFARLGLAALCALAACLVLLLSVGTARTAADLSLTVTFSAGGAVTVTLPDGTPVGSTSGSATVIPAGYYTLNLFGPGECINLPLFEVAGPGVALQDDMRGGEVSRNTLFANFLPNTTYTWHIDRSANVIHTFRTSSDVVGTQTSTPSSTPKSSSGQATSVDIVGADLLPSRGTIVGAVSAAGRLTLAFNGKSVSHLKPGKYKVAVSDESSSNGFLLQNAKKRTTTVTGAGFVGKHTVTVSLSAGKWLVLPKLGKASYSIVVS